MARVIKDFREGVPHILVKPLKVRDLIQEPRRDLAEIVL